MRVSHSDRYGNPLSLSWNMSWNSFANANVKHSAAISMNISVVVSSKRTFVIASLGNLSLTDDLGMRLSCTYLFQSKSDSCPSKVFGIKTGCTTFPPVLAA